MAAAAPSLIPTVMARIAASAGAVLTPIASSSPRARQPRSKAAKKRELMEQARRAGWRGRTYHSAKKFERKIERQARPEVASERVEHGRRPRWRRWLAKGRR